MVPWFNNVKPQFFEVKTAPKFLNSESSSSVPQGSWHASRDTRGAGAEAADLAGTTTSRPWSFFSVHNHYLTMMLNDVEPLQILWNKNMLLNEIRMFKDCESEHLLFFSG